MLPLDCAAKNNATAIAPQKSWKALVSVRYISGRSILSVCVLMVPGSELTLVKNRPVDSGSTQESHRDIPFSWFMIIYSRRMNRG